MNTTNTEVTEDDIGFVIHGMVRCGNAYIINLATIGEPFASALGTYDIRMKGKKFLLFTCCEDQEQHAKDNIKEIVSICNEMIKREEAVFTANHFGESESLSTHEKRTLH